MKSTKMTVARFLPLIALLTLAPLGPWSCTDAGDEPGSPTGPVTVYDPGRDYTGATVVVRTSDGSIQPGSTFTITAEYRDATGAAVTDAPLTVGSEAAYFSTPADPSYTNGEGKVSFQVTADTDCPSGTYEFAVYTFPATPMYGPSVSGYLTIQVGGGGISTVSLETFAASIEIGLPATFMATATVTSDCTPVFYYQAGGAGNNTTTWTPIPGNENPRFFTVSTVGIMTGPMAVTVRAYCAGNSLGYVDSGVTTIEVTEATP